MLVIDFDSLTRPIAADDPCGSDLDLIGDAAYMNFMASAEGLLPASYFVKDQSGNERPFDRSTVDFKAQFEAAKPFLSRTRDLRQLAILAKFCILDRDLPGFITCIRAIGILLTERWDEVHPRSEDGDFGLRLVALESIDVLPTVVMPLQFLPLVESRRHGVVNYRSHLIATGDIIPREDEEPLEASSIEKALNEAELPGLIEKRQQFLDLQSALHQIAQVWQEKSGGPITLDKLTPVVGKMVAFLDAAVTTRDPSAALAPVEQDGGVETDAARDQARSAGAAAPVRITCRSDAAAALAAVAEYFSRSEPSNPALLLVRQASQLLGKSFLEVMRILVPTHMERAAVNIGKDQVFDLPIERLAALSPESQEQSVNVASDASSGVVFKAQSRGEALDLLDQAGRYFRAAEPSSPIPFLIERARDLAQRDFLSVLKAILPADALKANDNQP